jgi:hypothetical protein
MEDSISKKVELPVFGIETNNLQVVNVIVMSLHVSCLEW